MADYQVDVFVASGAPDTGKTSTLRWLVERHGLRAHEEAPAAVLRALGDRCMGHPTDGPIRPIDSPGHCCPVCTPHEFTRLAFEEQQRMERSCAGGDFLDRGYADLVEFFHRFRQANSAPPRAWQRIANYKTVFLFEVMPELQEPRWGKTASQRTTEAREINRRIESTYLGDGHRVVRVPPGDISMRASMILAQVD